jgi:translocation and assembly module TamB
VRRWPAADAPIDGAVQVQVPDLGVWARWVPPGWRLAGELSSTAGVGGRFGAPEYTGELRGSGIAVRNLLQGLEFSDGELLIALKGDRAEIERMSIRGGDGTLTAEGQATFGSAPGAQLKVTAQRFRVLGRIDRQLVTSGNASLTLRPDRLRLEGSVGIDSGLFDISRSDAPSLDDDVTVRRESASEAATGEPPQLSPFARAAVVAIDIDLGDKLLLRGRGIDTRLAGQLKISTPGGRMSVNGTVRSEGGTYAAYRQKLEIERGVIAFSGPVGNPRLDILALRPNLDVRVGVSITGNALTPRVRLYSEPDMSETDKLSWLVLGRGPDGLGRADIALIQGAAMALLAGEGEGPSDQVLRAIGLDELSVRQTDGDVRETVISLGKQLNQRWYIGYERGVNATTGSWQVIYRVAQRFTVRVQSGQDNSLDLIWTWRFGEVPLGLGVPATMPKSTKPPP